MSGDCHHGRIDPPRPAADRRAHAVRVLQARHADAWVASASPDGRAHLVPLSYAWDGTHLILAVEASALTARHVRAAGRARLGLGTTRDVVMVDADLASAVAVGEAGPIAEAYAAQADWDPRDAGGDFAYLLLRPRRIQVWREANEIEGRTVMRDGTWGG